MGGVERRVTTVTSQSTRDWIGSSNNEGLKNEPLTEKKKRHARFQSRGEHVAGQHPRVSSTRHAHATTTRHDSGEPNGE